MEIKNLRKITQFCQKNGIKRLKTPDFELEISPDFKPERRPKRSDQPIIQVTPEEAERMPADDEMLHWSSPYFDELRAQRKAN